ncbi:MAG: aldo/keto reductase [Armatimonadetes bacterium]|nr:aldo/keto reductase [Armatimonadota bacterium]
MSKYHDETPKCSFCGRPATAVDELIRGDEAAICDVCVDACRAILRAQEPPGDSKVAVTEDHDAECAFCGAGGASGGGCGGCGHHHDEVLLFAALPAVICADCVELCLDERDGLGEGFAEDRYGSMEYRRCGRTGLKLPALSLGAWHNFGGRADFDEARRMLHRAFDLGITHFDLANNYGPPPGSAEDSVGRILVRYFGEHRDELVISTKAGYGMWPGPYGDFGSKKYLLASLDQSLLRLGLDYVDVFYHHRPDPDTPLDETMEALALAVQQGKALYGAVSNYGGDRIGEAQGLLRARGTALVTDQVAYSMLNRGPERDVMPYTEAEGLGVVAFCPLAQGLLTSKYLDGIPAESRAADPDGFLRSEAVTPELQAKLRRLNELALERGQTLAQMALQWVLRDPRVTTALIGARNVAQIEENVAALAAAALTDEELARIDTVLGG